MRGWIRSLRVGASRSDPSEFAEGNPSEIPSRTQSVSAFLFGKFSKGPRSFGKTLRDLIHPLMGNNRILCSFDARSQGASLLAFQGMENEETARWVPLHRRGRSKLPRLPKGEKNKLNVETPRAM